MRRRTYVALVGSLSALSGCLNDDPDDVDEDSEPDDRNDDPPEDDADDTPPTTDEDIAFEPIMEGLTQPVAFREVPEGDIRYVAERVGTIRVHGQDGLREEPLIDLGDALVSFETWEQGLLGIELHPEFATNRRLFVRYSAPPREGTPQDYSHTGVIAEFQVSDDRLHADPASERTVMEIPQPGPVHNAGDLRFGPDSYLYITSGDGGGGFGDHGPGHAEDWYDANPGGNGQDTQASLLGGILRIDVDQDPTESFRTDLDAPTASEGPDGYAIPEDNPLVDLEGHRDEYFAWGFRNPWQVSFSSGRFMVADVGGFARSVYAVEAGGNYGWNVKDGSQCYHAEDPANPLEECPDSTPEAVRGGEPIIDPIIEYEHPGDSSAIIGGHMYTNDRVTPLTDTYVFADLRPDQFGGLFRAQPPNGDAEWTMDTVSVADWPLDEEVHVYAFGKDQAGELYVLAGGFGGGEAAAYQIIPA